MIEVKNLTKKYGNHIAVDNISFKVETGQIYGFLGPNGAGKSTTMNIITGYVAATDGIVTIDGKDIQKEPETAKSKVGYLPELPPLYAEMTVKEYLDFVADLKKIPKDQRESSVRKVMEETHIDDMQGRLIRNLSKGYKQRVGLAEAMMNYPSMIILDEPSVGLDPGQTIEMREIIKDLAKEHTVLLSSHIMQEISAVCNEVIIINEGKIITIDTPQNIVDRMNTNSGLHLVIKATKEEAKSVLRNITEIVDVKYDEICEDGCIGMMLYTRDGIDIRERVFYMLAEAKLPLLSMGKEELTLEQAFIRLTGEGSRQFGGRKTKKGEKK